MVFVDNNKNIESQMYPLKAELIGLSLIQILSCSKRFTDTAVDAHLTCECGQQTPFNMFSF